MKIWLYTTSNTWDYDHYISPGYFLSLEAAKLHWQEYYDTDIEDWEVEYDQDYRLDDDGGVQRVRFKSLEVAEL